ncbi:MAG TPA: hypothetical protein VMW35_12195 [Myxococcota bacterium]|jgi:hypothetical protein|nr:hypothetical protein [Myxococcota bacterium]
MRPIHAMALLLGLALGPACTPPPEIRFLAPLSGASLTWMPLSVQLDFTSSANAATLHVTLNGNDVTPSFVLGAPVGGRIAASASGIWGGLVLPGTNQLVAEVGMGSKTYTASLQFQTSGDPYADAVTSFVVGTGGGFGQSSLPGAVTGPPSGLGLFQGSLGVFSLGLGGRIDLAFTNNVIVNGPGVDFTVFENAFLRVDAGFQTGVPFADPARVSVSQDGVTWYAFPCTLTTGAGPYWPGCAGIYPVFANASDPAAPHASIPTTVPIASLVGVDANTIVAPPGSGGDSFDLATVGLAWARYVRIESATFVAGPAGANNAGFDLDAAAAVHAVPATDANGNGIPDAVE